MFYEVPVFGSGDWLQGDLDIAEDRFYWLAGEVAIRDFEHQFANSAVNQVERHAHLFQCILLDADVGEIGLAREKGDGNV